MRSAGFSFWVLGIIVIIYTFSFFHYGKWSDFILNGGDSWGYYAYLPALFIHNDLDNLDNTLKANILHKPDRQSNPDNPFGIFEANPAENGKPVIKYTIGVATLQLPFFALAHGIALVSPYKADGFSPPYMFLVHLSNLFYVLFGLVFLDRVLRKFFEEYVSTLVLLIIGLGTNLYYFSVYNTGMAHGYLFFLYALLLYATVKWYDNYRVRDAVIVGLTCGLITLIRPIEIICLLIPLCFGISDWKSLKTRVETIGRHYKAYLVATGMFFLAGIPQLIYWKAITGEFLYYSYGSETLDLTNPHILKGMFSYRNGWLNYTPVMVFALLGLPFLYKTKQVILSVILFFGLHLYLIYSWHNPNYINGFGSRPMVEAYAILAFPLAAFTGMMFRRKVVKAGLLTIIGFFILLNLFQTWQCANGILWTEDAKRAYYWETFGKTKWTYEALIANDINVRYPDTTQLKFSKLILSKGFEDLQNTGHDTIPAWNGARAYHLEPEQRMSPVYTISLDTLGLSAGDWLKISGYFRSELPFKSRIFNTFFVARFLRPDGTFRKTYNVKIENKLGDPTFSPFWGRSKVWDHIHFFIPVTEKINPATDDLLIYFANSYRGEVLIDDVRVEHWVRR